MRYSNATLWYSVFLLTLASTLSFIDRQILNVMIGPIKRDLGGLSDTEISLIIGLAFSLVYSLTTLPIARLADRYSRRNVIIAGIFSWSAMTALAGMANTYWQLFVARMGVGVGEAALGPATTSMLADYFDDRRIALAYGVVATAPFIGTGLASMIGGPLIDYLEAQPHVVLPVFGEMFSWQTILVIVGLPGVLLALVMFSIPEPTRKGVGAVLKTGYSWNEFWKFILSRRRYLTLHFIAYLCLSIQGFAFLTWIVEFFVRKHGWSRTDIGLTYGSIAFLAGILGSVWAGFYAGQMAAKGRSDAPMRLTLWGTIALGPVAFIVPLLDSDVWAITLIVPLTFCMAMPPGLSNAALQAISPNRMRGQLIAVYLICVSFLSYLFAPLIIGLMNDYVFGREDAIGLSLASLSVVNYSIAAVCLYLSLNPLRLAVDQMKAARSRPDFSF